MQDDEKRELTVGPNQAVIESEVIEEVLQSKIEDAHKIIAKRLDTLTAAQKGTELELFLQLFWKYIEGLRLIGAEGNFLQSVELEKSAADGFRKLGFSELESISRSIAALAKANIELRSYNFKRAIDLFNETGEYLKVSGRFANKFESVIDHLKPETLFLGTFPLLLSGDFEAAKAICSHASAEFERVGKKYYKEGTSSHFYFLGMAQFVKAYFDYNEAVLYLYSLDLKELQSMESISHHAKEAENSWRKAIWQMFKFDCATIFHKLSRKFWRYYRE